MGPSSTLTVLNEETASELSWMYVPNRNRGKLYATLGRVQIVNEST